MRRARFLSSVVSVAAVVLMSVLPAAAATKTIPAGAFKPVMNVNPADVQFGQTTSVLFVLDGNGSEVVFWAPVSLPVGARITRLRSWFQDGFGTGTKLTLAGGRWGASTTFKVAEIVTSGAYGLMTKASTEVILRPDVASGDRLFLGLSLPAESSCGGVKIDYEP
jgi:hypothetical protein